MNLKSIGYVVLFMSLPSFGAVPISKKNDFESKESLAKRVDDKLKQNDVNIKKLENEKTEIMRSIEKLKTDKSSTTDASVVQSIDKLIALKFDYFKDLDARADAWKQNSDVLKRYKDTDLK
ncbi:MAG: hypothetical protein NTX86_02035 [Candidatus Dependentiae bacterium]|nr:hypothetical protein [Candidatus Dependentiae bacterium]